mgnify:FL=1
MNKVKKFFGNNIALVGLLIALLIGVCVQRTFISPENLTNLLRSASLMGFIGIGMTFVVLCGSIDLSVASVFALAGYLMLNMAQYNIILAFVVPLLAGAVIGFINGVLIQKLSIPAFIATLATQMFVRGLVQMFCDEVTYKIDSVPVPVLALGRLTFSHLIPLPLILFVAATLIVAYVLKRRFIGRSMYIVGGNIEAANMMGVSVPKTMITAHVLCSVLTCIGGMIYTSRVGVASPLAGTGYEMYAIAAVVLGGAKLTGGVGKVSGSFIGTLIMSSFSNIFSMQNVLDAVWSDVVVGAVLLIVIMAQAMITLRGGTRRKQTQTGAG